MIVHSYSTRNSPMFLKTHSLPPIESLISRPLTGCTPQLLGNRSREKSILAWGSILPRLYLEMPQISKSPTSFSLTLRDIFIGVWDMLCSLNLTVLGSSNLSSCSSGVAITSKSTSYLAAVTYWPPFADVPSPTDLKGPILRRPGSPR